MCIYREVIILCILCERRVLENHTTQVCSLAPPITGIGVASGDCQNVSKPFKRVLISGTCFNCWINERGYTYALLNKSDERNGTRVPKKELDEYEDIHTLQDKRSDGFESRHAPHGEILNSTVNTIGTYTPRGPICELWQSCFIDTLNPRIYKRKSAKPLTEIVLAEANSIMAYMGEERMWSGGVTGGCYEAGLAEFKHLLNKDDLEQVDSTDEVDLMETDKEVPLPKVVGPKSWFETSTGSKAVKPSIEMWGQVSL